MYEEVSMYIVIKVELKCTKSGCIEILSKLSRSWLACDLLAVSSLPHLCRPAVAAISDVTGVWLVVSGLPCLCRPAVAAVSDVAGVWLVVSGLPHLCRPAVAAVSEDVAGLPHLCRLAWVSLLPAYSASVVLQLLVQEWWQFQSVTKSLLCWWLF